VVVFGEVKKPCGTCRELYFAIGVACIDSIAGIAFKDKEAIVVMPERILIKNINRLSFPNRKKINLNFHIVDAWKQRQW